MRPAPIPDEEIWVGARRIVMAPPDGDLTNTAIAPVEMLVHESSPVTLTGSKPASRSGRPSSAEWCRSMSTSPMAECVHGLDDRWCATCLYGPQRNQPLEARTTIAARHETECRACEQPIYSGDRITLLANDQRQLWVHEDCA